MTHALRAFYLLFHLALFGLLSQFVFSYNSARLFIGNDGPSLLSLAHNMFEFVGFSFSMHGNFLQGLGTNPSFILNPSMLPSFWIDPYDASGRFAPASIYTSLALLTFLAVVITGWNYGFSKRVTYCAAWVMTILLFPFFTKYVAIYPVNASVPSFMVYMFCAAVGAAGIGCMGRNGWLGTAIGGFILLLAILLMLLISPASLILIVPYLAISGLCKLWVSGREERIRIITGTAAVLAICLAAGWVEYIVGLLLYTSSGFFQNELMKSYYPSREFGSILYQGGIADRAAGPILFALAALGAVYALCIKCKGLSWAVKVTIAGLVMHGLIGAEFIARTAGWEGPPPIYSEMIFFPLYGLFAVWLITRFLITYSPRALPHAMALLAAPSAVALIILWTLLWPPQIKRNMDNSYAMPPSSTNITDVLEKEITLTPGGAFAGRVAMIGNHGFYAIINYAAALNKYTRNDHLTTGLWFKNIPTLTEYNQIITPAFYSLIDGFLALPNDEQNRSWTNFSYADTKILRMLGVRFLLSNDAARDDAVRRTQLDVTGIKPLYLFELPDANIRGKSANNIVVVDSLTAAKEAMSKPAFDLHTAILFSPTKDTLVPVDTSSITLEQGGYRIRATSKGRTLLILPLEYSRCNELLVQSGNMPRMMRTNIALTGLLFENSMDVVLTTRIGPFSHPRCRLADYWDFKAITQ